ncbi:MAG: hypothetical protein JO023_27430 [Chloroflexi bacterium]|nr:hypothetical protein [Chloroflexota bacterium]
MPARLPLAAAGALVALLVVVVVVVGHALVNPAPSASPAAAVVPTSTVNTSTRVPTAALATPMLRATSTPVPEPTATAVPDVTVTLDEQTLTRALNDKVSGQTLGQTPLGPASASNLAVRLTQGQVGIVGTAQAGGFQFPLTVVATVVADAGRALVHVEQARVGDNDVPPDAQRKAEGMLQREVDQELDAKQLRVRSVTIDDGKMTMVGSQR